MKTVAQILVIEHLNNTRYNNYDVTNVQTLCEIIAVLVTY